MALAVSATPRPIDVSPAEYCWTCGAPEGVVCTRCAAADQARAAQRDAEAGASIRRLTRDLKGRAKAEMVIAHGGIGQPMRMEDGSYWVPSLSEPGLCHTVTPVQRQGARVWHCDCPARIPDCVHVWQVVIVEESRANWQDRYERSTGLDAVMIPPSMPFEDFRESRGQNWEAW